MRRSEKIKKIMNILMKYYPSNERTTLNRMRKKPNAFKILISCLLSLRTQDKNTAKVSKKLFEVADTPKKLSKIPIKKLEKLIFSSGHYKKKTKTLKHVSKELINKFNSKVPAKKELNTRQIEILEKLKKLKKITRKQYSKMFSISVPTAARDLKRLLDRRLLRARGPLGPGRWYELTEEEKNEST